MATRLSGKGILSGLASLTSGVVSLATLLASRVLGFTYTPGSGSGYYGASIVDRYLPGVFFKTGYGYFARLISSTNEVIEGQMPYTINGLMASNDTYILASRIDYNLNKTILSYSTDSFNWTDINLNFEGYENIGFNISVIDGFFCIGAYNAPFLWAGTDLSSLTASDFYEVTSIPPRPNNGGQTDYSFNAYESNSDHIYFTSYSSAVRFDKVGGFYLERYFSEARPDAMPSLQQTSDYIIVNKNATNQFSIYSKLLTYQGDLNIPAATDVAHGYITALKETNSIIYSYNTSNETPSIPYISYNNGTSWSQMTDKFTDLDGSYLYYTNYKASDVNVHAISSVENNVYLSYNGGLTWSTITAEALDPYVANAGSYYQYKDAFLESGYLFMILSNGQSLVHNARTHLYDLVESAPSGEQYLPQSPTYFENKYYFVTMDVATNRIFKAYSSESENLSNPTYLATYESSDGIGAFFAESFKNILTRVEVQSSIGNQDEGTLETLAPVDVYVNTTGSMLHITQVEVQNISPSTITYDLGFLDEGVSLSDSNTYLGDVAVLPNGATSFLTDFIGSGGYINLAPGQRVVVLPSSVDSVEVKVYGQPA